MSGLDTPKGHFFTAPKPAEKLTVRIHDPWQTGISFSGGSGLVLTMMPDGKIARGPGLSDDEATAAFVECLSQYLPTFVAALRQRTERAEATAEEAKRHIETLTGFYMDNVLWTRAAEEARAFVRSLEPPTYGKGIVDQIADAQADFKATYFGVSG